MTPSTTIRILKPGDEAALETFLLPRLESSMLLLGNLRAAGFVDNGKRGDGTYAATFEKGRITGAAAHFWNGNIILQNPTLNHEVWRAAVRVSGRGINGVLGPGEQVRAVQATLNADATQWQADSRESLYTLDLDELIVPQPLIDGQVCGRRIGSDDLDLMTRWNVAYSIELFNEKETRELWAKRRQSIKRHLAVGTMWVLEAKGRPLACSAFNSTLREAVQVGGVYTPPELRGRGYARTVVAQSLLDARAEGIQTGILFTGQENVAAHKAYIGIGFRVIEEYGLVLYREPVWLCDDS